MKTVKVVNNQSRLVNIMEPGPMLVGADGKERRQPASKVRTLKPGINLVPPDVLAFNRETVVFKALEAEGKIVIEEEVDEAIGKSIAGMKPVDAVKLVQATLDTKMLTVWQDDASTPPKVLAAIATQLEKIEAMGGKKE